MSEQRIEPAILINDAIALDRSDAQITLDLIERLTEQGNDPQTFSDEEFQTLIRNCIHAIVLHFTKTIEEPKGTTIRGEKIQTYNLESLIKNECLAEEQDLLRTEVCSIRGDHIYREILEYRIKIIAHRNIRSGSYQEIEQEFIECRNFLIQNKKRIGKLIERIFDLQVKIKNSRNKKRGLPSDSWSDSFQIIVRG